MSAAVHPEVDTDSLNLSRGLVGLVLENIRYKWVRLNIVLKMLQTSGNSPLVSVG